MAPRAGGWQSSHGNHMMKPSSWRRSLVFTHSTGLPRGWRQSQLKPAGFQPLFQDGQPSNTESTLSSFNWMDSGGLVSSAPSAPSASAVSVKSEVLMTGSAAHPAELHGAAARLPTWLSNRIHTIVVHIGWGGAGFPVKSVIIRFKLLGHKDAFGAHLHSKFPPFKSLIWLFSG